MKNIKSPDTSGMDEVLTVPVNRLSSRRAPLSALIGHVLFTAMGLLLGYSCHIPQKVQSHLNHNKIKCTSKKWLHQNIYCIVNDLTEMFRLSH